MRRSELEEAYAHEWLPRPGAGMALFLTAWPGFWTWGPPKWGRWRFAAAIEEALR